MDCTQITNDSDTATTSLTSLTASPATNVKAPQTTPAAGSTTANVIVEDDDDNQTTTSTHVTKANTITDNKRSALTAHHPHVNPMEELCRSCGKPNSTLYDLFEAQTDITQSAPPSSTFTHRTDLRDTGGGGNKHNNVVGVGEKRADGAASAVDGNSNETHSTCRITKVPLENAQIEEAKATPAPANGEKSINTTTATTTTTTAAVCIASVNANNAQGQNNMENILQEMQIWQLGIQPHDGLPQRICSRCTAQFNMLHKFRRKCLKVQIRLREMYGPDKVEEHAVAARDCSTTETSHAAMLNEQDLEKLFFNLPQVPKQPQDVRMEQAEEEEEVEVDANVQAATLLTDVKDEQDIAVASSEASVQEMSFTNHHSVECATSATTTQQPNGSISMSNDDVEPPGSAAADNVQIVSSFKLDSTQADDAAEQPITKDPLEMDKSVDLKNANAVAIADNSKYSHPAPATLSHVSGSTSTPHVVKRFTETSTFVTKAALKEYLIRKSQSSSSASSCSTSSTSSTTSSRNSLAVIAMSDDEKDAELLNRTTNNNSNNTRLTGNETTTTTTSSACVSKQQSQQQPVNYDVYTSCTAETTTTTPTPTSSSSSLASKRGGDQKRLSDNNNSNAVGIKRKPSQTTECFVRLKRLRGVESITPLREYEWNGDIPKPGMTQLPSALDTNESEVLSKFVEKKKRKVSIDEEQKPADNDEISQAPPNDVVEQGTNETNTPANSTEGVVAGLRRRVSSWKTKAEMKESSSVASGPARLQSMPSTPAETETDTDMETSSTISTTTSCPASVLRPSSPCDAQPHTNSNAIKIIIKRKRGRPFKRKSKNYIKIATHVDERGEEVEYEIKETKREVKRATTTARSRTTSAGAVTSPAIAAESSVVGKTTEPGRLGSLGLKGNANGGDGDDDDVVVVDDHDAEDGAGDDTTKPQTPTESLSTKGIATVAENFVGMQRKMLMAMTTTTTTTTTTATKKVILNNKELSICDRIGTHRIPPAALGFTQFIPVQNESQLFAEDELPKNLIIRIPLNALPEEFQKIHLATNTKLSGAPFQHGGLGALGTMATCLGGAGATMPKQPAEADVAATTKPTSNVGHKENVTANKSPNFLSSAAAERSETAGALMTSRATSPSSSTMATANQDIKSLPDLSDNVAVANSFLPAADTNPNNVELNSSVESVGIARSHGEPLVASNGEPKVNASSKINDFINEFQKHCMEDTEMDSDVASPPSVVIEATPASSSYSLCGGEQRIEQSLIDSTPQHLSASHLSAMNDVESALHGILNEMQDQHIYTPVPTHSDDFFDQSVYSPLANEPPPSPVAAVLSEQCAVPTQQQQQSSSSYAEGNKGTTDPFVQVGAAGGSGGASSFTNNFAGYGECFTEDSTQSGLIGFQNDIPCFENIELASTPNNGLGGGVTSKSSTNSQQQQQQQQQQQRHHQQRHSEHAPHLPNTVSVIENGLNGSSSAITTHISQAPIFTSAYTPNFFETSGGGGNVVANGMANGAESLTVGSVNRSAIQFTQLLTEQQQYHLQQQHQQLQTQHHQQAHHHNQPPQQQHHHPHQQQQQQLQQPQLVQLSDEATFLNNQTTTTTTNLVSLAGGMSQHHLPSAAPPQMYGKLLHGATLTSENTTKLQFITFAESTPQSIQLLNAVETASATVAPPPHDSLANANATSRLNVYTGVNPHEIQWTATTNPNDPNSVGVMAHNGGVATANENAATAAAAAAAAATTTTTTTTYYINAADLYQSNLISTTTAGASAGAASVSTLTANARQQISLHGGGNNNSMSGGVGGCVVELDDKPSMDANDNYLEGMQNQPIMIVIPHEFIRDGTNHQFYTNGSELNNGSGPATTTTTHFTFQPQNQTQPQTVLLQQSNGNGGGGGGGGGGVGGLQPMQQHTQHINNNNTAATMGNLNQRSIQSRNLSRNPNNFTTITNNNNNNNCNSMPPMQQHQQQQHQHQAGPTKFITNPHQRIAAAAAAAAAASRRTHSNSLGSPSSACSPGSALSMSPPVLSPQRRRTSLLNQPHRGAPIPLMNSPLPSAVQRHLQQYQRDVQQGNGHQQELKINLTCRFCHKRPKFTNNLDYSNHIIAMHPAENPYNCPYCPMHFTKRTKRQQHITEEHSTPRFNCAQCGQKFNAQRTLDLHLQRHHALDGAATPPPPPQSPSPLTLPRCATPQQQQQQRYVPNAATWSESAAAQNQKSSGVEVRVDDVHLQVSSEDKDKKTIDLVLDNNPLALGLQTTTHSQSHNEKTQLILRCPDCTDPTDGPCQLHQVDTAFSLHDTQTATTEHLTEQQQQQQHQREPITETEREIAVIVPAAPLAAPLLPQPTQSISMPSPEQTEPDSTSTTVLRQYRKRRTSGTKLTHSAQLSDTTTTSTSNATMSEQLVEEERILRTSHNCLLCEEQFTNEISLRKHHQLAHGNSTSMPYVCPICKRGFRMRIVLQRHMEAHEKEGRPYLCSICFVRFPRPSQLTLHKLSVHFLNKPHTCQECGKLLPTESALKAHMKSHGDRTVMTDMQMPRRIHNGERFYKCDICPSSFAHYTRLIAHLKTHIPPDVYLDEENSQMSADMIEQKVQESIDQALEDEPLSVDTEEVISKLLGEAEEQDVELQEDCSSIASLDPLEDHRLSTNTANTAAAAANVSAMPSPISSSSSLLPLTMSPAAATAANPSLE